MIYIKKLNKETYIIFLSGFIFPLIPSLYDIKLLSLYPLILGPTLLCSSTLCCREYLKKEVIPKIKNNPIKYQESVEAEDKQTELVQNDNLIYEDKKAKVLKKVKKR